MTIGSQYVRGKGGAPAPSGWDCTIQVSSLLHGTTTPSGVAHLATDEDLVAEAFRINGAVFYMWCYDGANYSANNPVTIPAEPAGEIHSLLAIFTGAIGIGAPIILTLQCIHDTEIIYPVIASISTVVAVVTGVPRWFMDSAYYVLGTINPQGLQVVASGSTINVIGTSNTGAGYVMATAPFKLDAGAGFGAVASNGIASCTVPAQTNNTWHQLVEQVTYGWGCTGTDTTTDTYVGIASGSTKTYTATGDAGAGHHWHILLDGVDKGNSPYVVPAQTNGTYHTVTTQSVPN